MAQIRGREYELTVEANCLLRGMHVVIRAMFWSTILQELQQERSGMSQMKAACGYVWWPGTDTPVKKHH